jgi:hypothetical protein
MRSSVSASSRCCCLAYGLSKISPANVNLSVAILDEMVNSGRYGYCSSPILYRGILLGAGQWTEGMVYNLGGATTMPQKRPTFLRLASAYPAINYTHPGQFIIRKITTNTDD